MTLPRRDELYALYLYCEAKIGAIDAGLNWYGYGDEFVPCWSFEHVYGVSRDLCNRGLDAEQRVFSLLQMYETACNPEFLATQQETLAGAQVSVAEAQVSQQIACNNLAVVQAQYSQQQAQAQENKSQVEAIVAVPTPPSTWAEPLSDSLPGGRSARSWDTDAAGHHRPERGCSRGKAPRSRSTTTLRIKRSSLRR